MTQSGAGELPRRSPAAGFGPGAARAARSAPDELGRRVFTHASWTTPALGLLRTARLSGRQRARAGRHHASVSASGGRPVRSRTADQDPRPGRLGPRLPCGGRAPRGPRAAANGGARDGGRASVEALIGTERVLASVIEAVIGACYLTFGYETTAAAVVPPSPRRSRTRSRTPWTSSRRLQERLARRGEIVDLHGRRRAGAAARPHLHGQRRRWPGGAGQRGRDAARRMPSSTPRGSRWRRWRNGRS